MINEIRDAFVKTKDNDRYRGDAEHGKCFAESRVPQPTYGISKASSPV
jgi:hypothetical protein